MPKKIGIAGIGGIGSNVAVNLVRAGVINFKIVDFDKVEEGNLNRQFYFKDQIGKVKIAALEENLKRINPKLNIEKEQKFLTKENIQETFKDYEVIVEGFDKAPAKAMLIETFANTDKLVISACGVAGLDIEGIKIKNPFKNIFIIGDFVSDVKDHKLYAAKVQIAASMMATIILKELKI